MFKGVKNFLSAAFIRWAKPDHPVTASAPTIKISPVYDPVIEVSVGEVFPWPSMLCRDDIDEICADAEIYLTDAMMSFASDKHKGGIDLLVIATKEGLKLQAYHSNTTKRRELIAPIDIAPHDPDNDDQLVSSMEKAFDEMKARGFKFENEEPARLALAILTETVNTEVNRPEIMRRSDIIRQSFASRQP